MLFIEIVEVNLTIFFQEESYLKQRLSLKKTPVIQKVQPTIQ